MDTTKEFILQAKESISRLREDLKSIRTGRSNPAMVESIIVETYGGQTKLKLLELATITTEGPSQLVVAPFDPGTVQDIEKAIQLSPLGLSPVTQGSRIIIRIPALSEEQRMKFTKITNQKVEEVKELIRKYRDEARKKIRQQEESSEITKDDRFRDEKNIDTETTKLMDELKTIKDNKQNEIMQV